MNSKSQKIEKKSGGISKDKKKKKIGFIGSDDNSDEDNNT